MEHPMPLSHYVPKSFKLNAIQIVAVLSLSASAIFVFSTQTWAQAEKNADAKSEGKTPPPKAALSVSAVSPSNSALGLRLQANGNVTAWQEAIIGAEVNGLKLLDVKVNVGDMVKKGQVLATFSADGARADVLQAQASVAEAQATAAEAAGNAARARSLQDTGALSAQQIAQYTTAETTAKARVEAARATLTNTQVRLKNGQLTAPDNGVISARLATVGSVVGAGSELFRMIRQGRLEWRAEVTSTEVARIKSGATATVTAASGAQVQGRVRMVAPTVDAQTRNALVYVDLPQHPDIKAGMFAKGEFALGSTNALTLPQQALVLRDGFTYGMRIEANNKISQIKMQTGRRVGDAVEVLQGAKAGERYVASGAAFLADGDTVKVVAAPIASAANSASAPK
jgi:HlyD family secretion protein